MVAILKVEWPQCNRKSSKFSYFVTCTRYVYSVWWLPLVVTGLFAPKTIRSRERKFQMWNSLAPWNFRSLERERKKAKRINLLSHSASIAQNTLLTSHSLIHLPPAHHSYPPSHIHCSVPGSKLTFSTNLFHHSLLAPTHLDCLLGLYWTGLTLLNGFPFLVNFFSFICFGSCGRLSWLNCQLLSAR